MLGFAVIGLTLFMIFTIVKNALVGKQLDAEKSYQGPIDLIIPLSTSSDVPIEPWIETLKTLSPNIKIHLLADGAHILQGALNELEVKFPQVTVHRFNHPSGKESGAPWMISEIKNKITAEVVLLGDVEVVPSQIAFNATAALVQEKEKPIFVLPQTAKLSVLGEAIALLNPTLALVSVFGFRKYRRNVSYPLMALSKGWIGMKQADFSSLVFEKMKGNSWKEEIVKTWEEDRQSFALVFGERYLQRYYSTDVKSQTLTMKQFWDDTWTTGNRTGLWLFALAIFVWSFPLLCFLNYPYWAIVSFGLLVLYRFFSKIVFQESWGAMCLHPLAAVAWFGTFIWWGVTGVKTRYSSYRK